MTKHGTPILVLALLIVAVGSASAQSVEADNPALTVLTFADPAPGATLINGTPRLAFTFPAAIEAGDPDADEQPVSISIDRIAALLERFDNGRPVNVYDPAIAIHNGTGLVLTVPDAMRLADGPHNITVTALGQDGTLYEETWSFAVDPSVGDTGKASIGLGLVVGIIVGAIVLGLAGLIGFIAYRKVTVGFNVRKFIARQQIPRQWFFIYIPVVVAAIGTLVALTRIANQDEPGRFAVEYALVGGVLVGAIPVGWGLRRQTQAVRRHEEAYAQFLFELADAMRGGLDPIKSLKEIARTEDGILKGPLRAAADSLALGRPFGKVMEQLATPMGSQLIVRYSKLVADASEVGGEVATVVYTAAKDMDELVKIEQERAAAVRGPMTTMYIAFGVLAMMAATLVDFAPKLGDIDIGALTGGSSSREVPRMAIDETQDRFFHLILTSSVGVGLLIGAFTQGSIKHGLLHLSILLAASAFAFPRLALGL